MVPSRRQLTLIALTVVLCLGHAGSASACSCVPLSRETVEGAEAAVIAELVAVRADEPASEGRFRYEIRRVLEGRRRLDRPRITVRSNLDSAACGLPQRLDRYGLVLGRTSGHWTASLCSVTTPKALRALAGATAAGSAGTAARTSRSLRRPAQRPYRRSNRPPGCRPRS